MCSRFSGDTAVKIDVGVCMARSEIRKGIVGNAVSE